MSIRVGIRPMGRRFSLPVGAWPMDDMEYVFTEGTASPYDVMYDTVHAVPATPVSAAQSTFVYTLGINRGRKLVRTSDGTLFVVYTRETPVIQQIYVKKSEDDGATWTDEVLISTDAGMDINAQQLSSIAVDSSDNLHVVWQGIASDFAVFQIRYAKGVPPHAAGDWTTPIRISTAANMGASSQTYAAIAVDSNDYLHVLWHGKATGFTTNDQIWYRKYTTSWGTIVRISDAANMAGRTQNYPDIAVDSEDNLHVVFTGGASDIAFTQTRYTKGVPPHDAGDWVTPIRISTAANMGTITQYYPCIAVDGDDNLHVVWDGAASDFVTRQIRYATAVPPHAAGDWVTPIRISTAANMGANNQLSSSIAVDSSDNLHVVWHGMATGYLAQVVVWYAVYVISWAAPEVLQPTGRNQFSNLRWSRWPR